MRCKLIILGIILTIGLVLALTLDWKFFLLTGRFTPIRIVEILNAPIPIVSVMENGLITADGRLLSLPGITNIPIHSAITKTIREHGIEVGGDGTIYGLVQVIHWCGNDPVKFHRARVDLSSLFLALKDEKNARATDFGVDHALFALARIPHEELRMLYQSSPRR